MTDDKLTQDVKSIVDGILQQKEEAEMRKEIEEALEKSAEKINELVSTLEAKDNEMGELQSQIKEFEGTVAELSDKISELEKEKENLEKEKSDFEAEKEELVKQAEEVKTELDNIKKDQLAQARFEELKEAGVAATDDKAIEDQIAKIREMEDEAFVTYKEERVELRKSILSELESSGEESNSEEEASEEENSEEEASEGEENAAEGEEEEEAAADSEESFNNPMKSIASMFDMEITPKKEMKDKYRELGAELAKRYKRGE